MFNDAALWTSSFLTAQNCCHNLKKMMLHVRKPVNWELLPNLLLFSKTRSSYLSKGELWIWVDCWIYVFLLDFMYFHWLIATDLPQHVAYTDCYSSEFYWLLVGFEICISLLLNTWLKISIWNCYVTCFCENGSATQGRVGSQWSEPNQNTLIRFDSDFLIFWFDSHYFEIWFLIIPIRLKTKGPIAQP